MTNVQLDEGLKYLAPLGDNTNVQELCITFNKLITLKKAGDMEFMFPKGKNMTLKKLTIHFWSTSSVGNVHGSDDLIL